MALYQVHFIDYGGNVRATHFVQQDSDEAAIAAAHQLNVLPRLSAGFEVWKGERLLYRHQN
jgi:hypothetical protein